MARVAAEIRYQTKRARDLGRGLSSTDLMELDRAATDLAEEAGALAAEVRDQMGVRGAKNLLSRLRKAMGFTHY